MPAIGSVAVSYPTGLELELLVDQICVYIDEAQLGCVDTGGWDRTVGWIEIGMYTPGGAASGQLSALSGSSQ